LLVLEPEATFHIAKQSLEIKARIVEQDPLDNKGIRIVLNYGHTIGHAIEAASGYSYKHGEAISIGMVGANLIACELGLLQTDKADRIKKLLQRLGLPTASRKYDVEKVLNFLSRDKKFTNRTNRFVLPTDIGTVKVVSGIDEKLIQKAIQQVTAA
jgi:3-dehydroquinate synthase